MMMTAYTLDVPSGWKFAGTIARDPGCHSNGASLKYTMQSTDGLTGVVIMPGVTWNWRSNPQMQKIRASSHCPAVDLDSAASFLINIAVPIRIHSPQKETMKNAHERFGVLEYTKRMKDTTTRIRLRLDRFIGEIEEGRVGKAHLISVLGTDSDVGAVWAAVTEQNFFTVEAPDIEPLTATLGEDAQCFRGTITIGGRKPIRHLVAISAELAKTRPGADTGGRRTILCDNDPTFVLYRISQRFGLPVVPEWAGWFSDELTRRGAIKPLIGLECSPVLVSGTKKLFLKWIQRALRQKWIRVPEPNGPVQWGWPETFFQRIADQATEVQALEENRTDL